MSLLLTASAVNVPLQLRMDPCEQEVEDNEQVTLDGPTSDGTAGIGAEFESPMFTFTKSTCSKADMDLAKRQIVAGRTGKNFNLTADSVGSPGILNAEYILDVQQIKVGSGDAATAAAAVAQDLISATTCLRVYSCDNNGVRLLGSPGTEPAQTVLTLIIIIAIRGLSGNHLRVRIRPTWSGNRKSLHQCPSKRCIVL